MHERNPPSASGIPDGLDAMARQYWDAWSAAAKAMPGMQPPQPVSPWQSALDAWSTLAHGGMPQTNDVIGRFRAQSGPWFGQMQQLAAQFAGVPAGADEVAQAWRRMLGAGGSNPFAEMTAAMRGHGTQGFERWLEQVTPFIEGLRGESASWLRTPTFGVGREQQERWQQLALALAEYQQRTQDYNALMLQATEAAHAVFERKLGERGDSGKPVESARALFDLWVDAAEDAYAKIALSKEFREVYGRLGNAQMRLRAGVQREVEQVCASFGMPTRSELDGAHRKIVDLERQMRRLRDVDHGKVVAPSRSDAPARATRPRSAGKAATPKKVAKKRSVATPTRRQPAKSAVKTASRSTAKKNSSAAASAGRKKRALRSNVARRQRRGPAPALPDIPIPVAPLRLKGKR